MKRCENLRERMIAVASASGRWSAEESAHLQRCAGCAAEWTLVTTAARLGRGIETRIDSDRMAARVVARSARRERRPRLGWLGWGGLAAGVAALIILAIAVTGGQGTGVLPDRPVPAEADLAAFPLPELDSLSTTELNEVLDGLDAPLPDSDADSLRLDDLTTQQLERLLRFEEG